MEIGNQPSRNMLRRELASPPKAMALAGPSKTGKWDFASSLIEDDSPDGLHVDGSIDGAREVLGFMRTSPVCSPARIALVDARQGISEPAQDAYLKICEEMPEASIILFVLEDAFSLRPALVSRLSVIPWLPLSRQEMDEFVSERGLDRDDFCLSVSQGRPFAYEAILSNIEILREFHARILDMARGRISLASCPKALCNWSKTSDDVKDAIALTCSHALSSASGNPAFATIMHSFLGNVESVPSANAEIHWWLACMTLLRSM